MVSYPVIRYSSIATISSSHILQVHQIYSKTSRRFQFGCIKGYISLVNHFLILVEILLKSYCISKSPVSLCRDI